MTDAEKKLLTDILISINSINDYLGGKRDFEEYKQNKMQRRAVERELEIIGEATNNFLKLSLLFNSPIHVLLWICATGLFMPTTM